MAEFENPYAEVNPFIRAHYNCPECGGKLWEYAIQRRMVCEDCRGIFSSDNLIESYA